MCQVAQALLAALTIALTRSSQLWIGVICDLLTCRTNALSVVFVSARRLTTCHAKVETPSLQRKQLLKQLEDDQLVTNIIVERLQQTASH